MAAFSPRLPRAIPAPFSACVFAVIAATSIAAAQSVVYTTRLGGNLAYCGHLSGGPLVNHQFTTVGATNDSINISDPGGPPPAPPSAVNASVVVNAAASGLSIAVAGTATRGGPAGFGIAATADGRDGWSFTVGAAVRFTLNISLSAASTETTVPLQAFNFFVSSGSVIPDPGTVWPPSASVITTPGSLTVTASGILTPGQYHVDLFGRAEGNSAPYAGSYNHSLTLGFVPAATLTTRNVSGNPLSYTGGVPLLGQPWHASVNLAQSGHTFAIVYASLAPANVTIGPGLNLLIAPPVVEFLPITAGPLVNYTFQVPANPTLAGFQIFTQALHFAGTPTFVLSNALDLTLGF